MRLSLSAASATALLAGVAVAEPLTVITPCVGTGTSSVKPITVTKQYQQVSTCATTSTCAQGTCTTKYPFETFAYVNTVIPAAWNGKSAQPTQVTSTTQTVTVSRFSSTLTKWVTPPVTTHSGTTTKPKPTPIYLTIAKDFVAPYNKLGPLAIPGYDGSGLCKECEVQADGSRSQVVGVTECRAGPGGAKCMGYDETWISKPAPSTSAPIANRCATRWVAPSAGTYTFTFPFVAPARTITAAETTITVGPVPYWAYVTRRCHRGGEVVDFTTTITKTVYWYAPPFRQPPRTSSAVPLPTGSHAFPGWPRPGHGNDNGVDGNGGDPYSWADWGSDDASDPSRPIPSNWADWVVTASTAVPYTSTSSVSQGPIGQTTSSYGFTSTTSSVWSSSTSSSSSFSASTSSTSSFGLGPIDGSTTSSSSSFSTSSTSSFSTSTSSTSSFGLGPIDGSTTSSSTSSLSSTSSFGVGPIDGSTTTSSSSFSLTTSSSSSFGVGPIDGSTTTSSSTSSSGVGPIDGSTTSTSSSFSSTSSFGVGPIDGSTTTSSASSTSSVGPIDSSTTSTSTSSFSVTTSSTSSFGVGPIDGSTTTSSTSSFSSVGPIEVTSSTSSSLSTTSVDSTTSTITTFSTSTSASTTSSASSTTSSLVAIPVNPNGFVVGVGSTTKYRKRALQYLKISSGGDAVLTADKSDASIFSLSVEGYLKVGDLFVDADSSQPWISFSLSASISASTSTWSISASGVLSLSVPNNGVCVSADNSVFIQFSGTTPFACVVVVLAAEVPNPTSTSSTAGPTTTAVGATTTSPVEATTTSLVIPTTTSEAATTTTSFDPSGDLDADIAAPTNVRRGVQYGSHRFGRRFH